MSFLPEAPRLTIFNAGSFSRGRLSRYLAIQFRIVAARYYQNGIVDVASGFAFGYDPTGRSVLFKIERIPYWTLLCGGWNQITIPMARWMAISISVILTGLMAPEKGPRIRKDLSRQVICSHLIIDVRLRPPCPLDSSTWVGLGRRFVEMGTTLTSLAKRFRTSKETIKAGLDIVSLGWPGKFTR